MDVATLVDGDLTVEVSHDPHPKEMLQFAEILHLKFRSQFRLSIRDISSVLAGNEQIAHPKHNIDVALRIDVKTGLAVDLTEPILMRKVRIF